MQQKKAMPIAIIGMNALYPGSVDKYGFWKNILEGNDLITDIPESHFLIDDYYDPNPGKQDKIYCKRGGFLPDVDFDPIEFGITPNSIPATDTSQLLALMVAKQVLEEAGGSQFESMDRDRISVILGVASTTDLVVDLAARIQRPVWVKALREGGLPEDQVQELCDRIANQYTPWQEASFPGLLGNVVAGRIANRLNLGGTNVVTDAACASSLSAISMSIMELATYKSDLVISGGVDTLSSIFMHMCFTKTPALSRTSDCRPFSDQADGTLLGEGIGMVALKRLEDAERDNDRIYAVIQGYGSSSDGLAKSVYAPRPEGQAKALKRAYEMAGYGPETVELVEAHGTGTKAGDIAEFEGLRTIFEESGRSDLNWCALGSVKSQIGHTKAASGAAGLFKVVMALHHKVLPPTIKVDQPNLKLDIDNSPFYLNTEARPWIRDSKYPRRASLSSFGFGGSNFHMTVEEYRGDGEKAFRMRTSPSELVVLGSDDPESLIEAIDSMNEQVASGLFTHLEHLARTTQEAYQHKQSARLAIVVEGFEELQQKLEDAKTQIRDGERKLDRTGLYIQIDHGSDEMPANELPKTAFLFPGQGSQYVGMTKDLSMVFDEARETWDHLAEQKFDGLNVHEVVFPLPSFSQEEKNKQEQRLKATEWAQPAIGAASLSILAVLERLGIQPDCVGGHSFGEITALRAAGVIDDKTMIQIARKRGELMGASAETHGVMTAVFHDPKEIEKELEAMGGELQVANYNSSQQCVLSGLEKEMEYFEQRLKEKTIRYHRLPVANAFHSLFVSDSVDPFKDYLSTQTFYKPKVSVYSNLDGKLFPKNSDAVKNRLARQIAAPVHFQQQIEAMMKDGVNLFIEIGPASVLSGLVHQCAGNQNIRVVSMDRKDHRGLAGWWQALGQLVAAGISMDLSTLWETTEPIPETSTDSNKKMSIKINGGNYGRPYPPKGGSAVLPGPNPNPEPITVSTPMPVSGSLERTISHTMHQSDTRQYEKPTDDNAWIMDDIEQDNTMQGEDLQGGISVKSNGLIQLQKQVIETHETYLKLISQSHAQFMKTASANLQSSGSPNLGQIIDDDFIDIDQGGMEWDINPSMSTVELIGQPTHINTGEEAGRAKEKTFPEQARVYGQTTVQSDVSSNKRSNPVARTSTVSNTEVIPKQDDYTAAASEVAVAVESPNLSIEDTILDIVSEKTGYPADMLDKDADLEAGLGIDSIKRVEIFAALQERIPGIPEFDPSQLSSLNSLGEIEKYLDSEFGSKKKS